MDHSLPIFILDSELDFSVIYAIDEDVTGPFFANKHVDQKDWIEIDLR